MQKWSPLTKWDELTDITRVNVTVFNATISNISVASLLSILLMEETGVPGENNRPVVSHRQTLSLNVVSSSPRLSGIQTHNFSGDRHKTTIQSRPRRTLRNGWRRK
jgi:hypothetical protein